MTTVRLTRAAAPCPDAPRAARDRGPVVLLVEDSAADLDLTCLAIDGDAFPGTAIVARDGVDALAFLRREVAHAGAPTPALVLLDLDLPRLDGRGVLTAMKRDAALEHIPVVMFTSSSAPEDVAGAYDAGCSFFVTKPIDLDAYLAAVRRVVRFWLAFSADAASGPERSPRLAT